MTKTRSVTPSPFGLESPKPGLVSIIIPVKNGERYIERTLKSIRAQTYPNIEIIVVDNFSKDKTPEIAKRYTENFYQKGPERQAQRAFGFEKAKGEFYVAHACDLVLAPTAIQECVDLMKEGWDGVEIDWVPDVTIGYWAKVRRLEMELYMTDQKMFRPNFSRVEEFRLAGGFNLGVTIAGDDYSTKLAFDRIGARCTAAKSRMLHIGEPRFLSDWVRKDVYYGKSLPALWKAEGTRGKMAFAPPLRTYWRNRKILFRAGSKMFFSFIFYRFVRYASGTIGIVIAKTAGWRKEAKEA